MARSHQTYEEGFQGKGSLFSRLGFSDSLKKLEEGLTLVLTFSSVWTGEKDKQPMAECLRGAMESQSKGKHEDCVTLSLSIWTVSYLRFTTVDFSAFSWKHHCSKKAARKEWLTRGEGTGHTPFILLPSSLLLTAPPPPRSEVWC